MLFYLLHSSAYYDGYVKSGQYAASPMFTHLDRDFWELKDKLFGIIGLDAIGKRVAQLAEAFGARVAYYSTSGKNLEETGYPRWPLEDLLRTADVVSIHCRIVTTGKASTFHVLFTRNPGLTGDPSLA
jgi:phosphoglycerate dehydrogenase-like enzyme